MSIIALLGNFIHFTLLGEPILTLNFDVSFEQLYQADGLLKLDARFLHELAASQPELAQQLLAARQQPDSLMAKQESALLIAVGPHLEDFIAKLFQIQAPVSALASSHHALAPLYVVKRQFVQRTAVKNTMPNKRKA